MWILKKINEDHINYLITEKKTYTVGRKNCDILLDEDNSISRKHCTIFIANQNDCPFNVNTATGVWIVDEKSKYGTYLKTDKDWVKLNLNENQKLNDGSIIRFGLMKNIYRVEYKPIIVCTSGVQPEQKNEISKILKLIDGELRNVWSKSCSIMIVSEFILTVKVVLALIHGIPIVTSKYITKVVGNIRDKLPFPNYKEFKPVIQESILDESLVSWDKTRTELFKGKTFIIPTKRQLETLKEVILSAGGKVELFSSNGNRDELAKENVIVLQLPVNSSSQPQALANSFDEITSFLKTKHGRRVVPECEIPLAVVYSSIEKYCNPKSTCFELRKCSKKTDCEDRGVVLVEETPEIPEIQITEPCVISSSSISDSVLDSNKQKQQSQICISSRKRGHSPSYNESESQKRKTRKDCDDDFPLEMEGGTTDRNNQSKSCKKTGKAKEKSKTTFITNFFKKQDKQLVVEESEDEQSQINTSIPASKCTYDYDSDDFWNVEKTCKRDKGKRKLSTESHKPNDDSTTSKKARMSSTPVNRSSTQKSKELNPSRPEVDESDNVRLIKKLALSFNKPFRRPSLDDDNLDLANFIGKEESDGLKSEIDELNCTIYSLTIISAEYLKEDGSLVDPPSVPVNVKKFKKQKVGPTREYSLPIDVMEDLSGDGWLEPHPFRSEIEISQRDEW